MTPSDTPVLVLGARSDIARHIAMILAGRGHPLMLAARNAKRLEADVSDLAIRYDVLVTGHEFDVQATDKHQAFLQGLPDRPGIIICAVGLLGDQEVDANDPQMIRNLVDVNFTAPCMLLEEAALQMAGEGKARKIIAIGSVAGDRGRAKNYIYGAAKAGFGAYMSGLRQKYARSGLHIMTVKPGFVRTAMTEGMDLPDALTSEPGDFAARVVAAMDRGAQVYYHPLWRAIMGIITHVPERIFMKMKF